MFRIAKILLCFLFISLSFPQERETNFHLVYPEFIPVNSSFDISLTFTNSFPEAKEFELIIIPDEHLTINRAELKSIYESTGLEKKLINSDEFFEDVYKFSFPLNDSTRSEGIVFQVLINLQANQVNSAEIKLKGAFKNESAEVAALTSKEFNYTYEDFIAAEINFYKPQKTSGKALAFGENGYLLLDIEKEFENNLLLDFWIKLNESPVRFLEIYNREFKEPALVLSTNKFQMLSVSSEMFSQQELKPFFIGKKSWYHISITTSEDENVINFYCNGNLIAKNKLPQLFEENDLRFRFVNQNKENLFNIDLLRIADTDSTEKLSFTNRHSIQFSSDNSSVAAIFKMDASGEFYTQTKDIKLEFSDVRFVKSNSPLFAKSPELNINLLGNSYELTWKGGDYKHAKYYILEKSSGSSYKEIYTVHTDNSAEKIYSYIDAPDEASEIVYYRIKQVNYDGSVVYSSQVKVGQGETEPFIIGQNYPNPFNPKTSIEIDLLQDSEIEITIYSLDGREITKLYKGYLNKGHHKFDFDGEGLPSGVYLYKIDAPSFTQTRKMILTK